MARRKKSLQDVEQVDYYEEDSDGFSEGDVFQGKVLSSFSFAEEPPVSEASTLTKALEFSPVSVTTPKEDLTAPTSFQFSSLGAAAQKKEPAAPTAFEFNSGKTSFESLTDNRKTKTEAAALTPSVDGEAYSIGRYYKLRYSTAKMLNEIKAGHEDVNVYMNNIVDEAIRWYYEHLFREA